MIKILADKDIPFLKGVLEPFARVEYLDGREVSPEVAADASAIITRTRTRCDETLLKNSSVKIIATATIGYDHIDMDYCARNGITVATAAGCNARGVLQWVAAVLRHLDVDPSATVLGVVGVGNVGRLVEQYGRMWGFEVICCDPVRQRNEEKDFLPFDEIASRADIITFHVPLTRTGGDATLGMASDRFFGMLKPGTVILNSSRGEVVDQDALLSALDDGRCRCAIDTWCGEPAISPTLAGKAMLATPHIAGYSLQGKANATAMSVHSLANYFGWEPLKKWFPEGVAPSRPRDISWSQMCSQMPGYFDIEALSDTLKGDIMGFEQMRNDYDYRQEFF